MIEFCKLLFDFSLYYTLAGFYAGMGGLVPSAAIFAGLAGAAACDALLRGRRSGNAGMSGQSGAPAGYDLRTGLLTLGAAVLAAFLFRSVMTALEAFGSPVTTGASGAAFPAAYSGTGSGDPLGFHPAQLLLAAPAAVYGARCFILGLTDTDYDSFRSRFLLGCRLLALLLPGFLFWDRAAAALPDVVPYICLQLFSGIALLRMLRDDRRSGRRQAVILAVFLALGLALTAAGVLQKTGFLIGWLYSHVLSGILMVCGMLVAYLFFYVLLGLYMVLKFLSAPGAQNNEQMEQMASDFREMPLIENGSTVLPEVLRYLAFGVLALLVLMAVRALFRSLEGRTPRLFRDPGYTDRRENLRENGKKGPRRPGLFRPSAPGPAVRYYYAKFLRECAKRGVELQGSMTSEEITGCAASTFPETETAALRRIYVRARYGGPGQVDERDAKEAERLWKVLRSSRQEK